MPRPTDLQKKPRQMRGSSFWRKPRQYQQPPAIIIWRRLPQSKMPLPPSCSSGKDGKTAHEAITYASQQLFKRSTINATSSEPATAEASKGDDKRKYPEHTSDASSPDGDTHTNTKVPSQEQSDHFSSSSAVKGITNGGDSSAAPADEASAAGETARENSGKTSNGTSAGKARSPQAGVRVGNVPAAGANAIESEGDDVPQFSEEQQSTVGATLDRAQEEYERAVSGFRSNRASE